MTIPQRRPVMCYQCGRILGYVETTLDQEGMRRFREKAEQLKREHQCSVPPGTRKANAPKAGTPSA